MFKRETRRGLCTLLLGWSLMEPRSCWGYNRSRQLSGNERATNPLLCDMEGQRKKIKKRTYFTCCHVERIQSSFGEAALKDFLFLSSVGLLPIVCQNINSYLHFCLYFYNVFYSQTIIPLHALYFMKQKNP